MHGTPRSSTRAELFGCLSILSTTRFLEAEVSTAINVRIKCNNKRTIDVANGSIPKRINLILHNLLSCIQEKISAHYIKTQQDEDRPPSELFNDFRAQIRCHHRAKAITQRLTSTSYELLQRPFSLQKVIFFKVQGILPANSYS